MSIRLMSEVWDLVELSQSETLVALALADHADDEGRSFPSIDRIARKARLGRRRTQQVVRNLAAAGLLTIDGVRGRANRYVLHLGRGGATSAPVPNSRTRATASARGGATASARGGATASAPESSIPVIQPSGGEAPDGARRDLVGDPIDDTSRRKANGNGRAYRLPEDFALTPERTAYAVRERVDPERTFAKFCDHWRAASGARARKHDWDAAWRNWCRDEADRARRGSPGTSRRRKTFDEIFGPKED